MELNENIINEVINDTKDIKTKLLILIIFHTGAMAKNIQYMMFTDFDIRAKTLRMNNVTYPIPGHVITLLSEYVARNGKQKGYLFTNMNGGFYGPLHIKAAVNKAFQKYQVKVLKSDIPNLLANYKASPYNEPTEFINSLIHTVRPMDIRKFKISLWMQSLPLREARRLAGYYIRK